MNELEMICFQIGEPLNQEKLIDLIPQELVYNVSNILTEFDVVQKSFVKKDTFGLQVRLVFKRILLFHLVNTYFPMLSLLIIVEITLFFDEKQLQSAIALNLTVLLVMYTMYQGVNFINALWAAFVPVYLH
jgi:hypothetical protein